MCMAVPFSVRLVSLTTMNDLTDIAFYRKKRLLGSQNIDITNQLNYPCFGNQIYKPNKDKSSTVLQSKLDYKIQSGRKKRHLLAKHFH